MGPSIIGLGKSMQSHLSYSDLFTSPAVLSDLYCVYPEGAHRHWSNETSYMEKTISWLWVFHHCVSHIPANHRRTEQAAEKPTQLWGWRGCSLQKTRLPMSYMFSHTGGDSTLLEVKAKKIYWEFKSEERDGRTWKVIRK